MWTNGSAGGATSSGSSTPPTSTASPDGEYEGRLVHYLAKQAVNRMAWAMAQTLREHHIAAVALSPVGRASWVLSGDDLRVLYEALQTEGGVEMHLRADPRLANAQSLEYSGRAVAVLAAAPDVLAKTGQVLKVPDLAEEYGFTDIDGKRPPHDQRRHMASWAHRCLAYQRRRGVQQR